MHTSTCLICLTWTLSAMFMAAALPFSHLRELSLVNVPRLKDKHLAPLTRLAGSLTSLQLTGCSSVTKAACPLVLGQLTNLWSLALSGDLRLQAVCPFALCRGSHAGSLGTNNH